MSDWIKAANPLGKIESEGEAVAAARMSAVALWITAAYGLVGAAWLMMNKTAVQAAMTDAITVQTAGQTPEAAAVATSMMQNGASIGIGIAVTIAVVQLILGFVQWKKPNPWIPIIFLILTIYALATQGWEAISGSDDPSIGPDWKPVVGLVILVVCLVLHWAGLNGANRLSKLRPVDPAI